MSELPRGIRNSNPGNIRISDTKWQGKVPLDQNTDDKRSKLGRKEFEQFIAPEYGIRAIAKIILTYDKQGINTIRKAITRWAPPNENDTDAYVTFVTHRMKEQGFLGSADDVLDFDKYEIMLPFVSAIIMQENGATTTPWYDTETMRKGLLLAGIADAPPPPVKSNPNLVAASAAGGVGTITVVSQAVQSIPYDQISAVTPLIQQVITTAPWVIGAILILGALYFAYTEYQKHKANTNV